MLTEFRELRSLIQKACKGIPDAPIEDRFGFTINCSDLEKILTQNKTGLHVMSFTNEIVSHVADITDIQLLTEYVFKKDEIMTILDGKTQIAFLMLYGTYDGKSVICDNNNNPISDADLYNILNNNVEDQQEGKKLPESKDLITHIASELPIHRVLLIKRFNKKREIYQYSIYFRYNYYMLNYINDLKKNSNTNSEGDASTTEK